MNCEKCGKEFFEDWRKYRRPDYIKKHPLKFCSRNCANSHTQTEEQNQKRRKKLTRRVRGKCSICGVDLFGYKINKCRKCYRLSLMNISRERTIKEVASKHEDIKRKHIYQPIRNDARKILNKLLIEKKCSICGYSKHVEVCHKKGISEFDENSTLKEVNEVDNLVYLCPNHHWELDKGMLRI